MLRYMNQMGLQLGTRVEVREKAPFSGPLQLKINANKEEVLGLEVACNIFVDLAP